MAVITVTSSADSGDGTLRRAVAIKIRLALILGIMILLDYAIYKNINPQPKNG